ncbi:hypothetical protein WJX82_002004 [Trebouxia sp. C0006]
MACICERKRASQQNLCDIQTAGQREKRERYVWLSELRPVGVKGLVPGIRPHFIPHDCTTYGQLQGVPRKQDCQLSCGGRSVELKRRLHEFPGSSTGTVCLEATLRPSAALHIWQAFHQANLSEANVVYLADIWEGATEQSDVIDSDKAQSLAAIFKSKGTLVVALAALNYNGEGKKEKARRNPTEAIPQVWRLYDPASIVTDIEDPELVPQMKFMAQAVGEALLWLLHYCLAGHLLDPNMEVGTAISRGLQPLMHDWCSRGNIAKDLTCSILAPMFLRLASNHEELLAYEPGVQESADVVQPEQAELVWQLIVDIIDSPWSSLVERRWQLTFGACWARLATQHWELAVGKARKSTVFGKESAPGGGVEPGSRLVSPDILVTICRHIQAAVLAPLPWDMFECISLARVLQRMAHLLKQQPLHDSSVQQAVQQTLVLGGLLFTQLAERHSFNCTGNATQEQAECLLPCLTPEHDFRQLVFAPLMYFLVLGASTEGKRLAPILLHMLPGVELAARLRPDPDLHAFSMEPPLRVAQALMQYLAVLLSALRQRQEEARMIQSVALSASKRRERTPQQDVQQQLTSKVVAAAIAQEVSCASYHEERGRPVPARLPLQLKLNEVNIKNLVELVVPCLTRMWRQLGWEDIFSEAQRGGDMQAQLDLKDNFRSIVHARGLPDDTLADIMLIFAYLLEDAPAHDSASAAAAELVAEEEQAATKAAAKKAKKLRQKLKAKKQAQPEPSASAAEPHDACTPSDDAHTSSNDAQPLSAASSQLSLSADADFLQQLFCCPLTEATMVEPTIAADGHTYERRWPLPASLGKSSDISLVSWHEGKPELFRGQDDMTRQMTDIMLQTRSGFVQCNMPLDIYLIPIQ